MKSILIIGAGKMQLPMILKCNDLGYRTIVTDGSKDAPGLKEASIPLVIDTLDLNNSLEAAKEYQVGGAITTSDSPVNTVAYVCEQLNLSGINRKGAKISTNKHLQRQILHDNRIRVPNFVRTNCLSNVKHLLQDFKYPLVIKPIDSSASRGVTKIDAENELEQAFSQAVRQSRSGQVIIEEFVVGDEYSVECLTQNGQTNIVAITEKATIKSDYYFVEERHIVPASLSAFQTTEIEQYVHKILPLFEVDNTASHIEIKLTDQGPVLIEMGARLGGDFITSDLVPLATGINIMELAILIAMGQPVGLGETEKKFAGIQFIHKDNYEQAIKACKKEGFAVKWEIGPYSSAPVRSSLDRLGHMIFQEKNREDLERKLSLKTN